MSADLRILVVDDHEMIRRGLRATLESHAGWQICGEAANGRDAVRLALDTRPDVVLMDLTMPEMNGLEATRSIRKVLPRTEVLILTMHESEQLIHEVLAAGAHGYVLKSDAGSLVVTAVEQLSRHRTFFTSAAGETLLRAYMDPQSPADARSRAADDALTPRERQTIQLIAEGRSTKEVASSLGISVKTAETHRTNLMRKLQIHSVSELVRYAIRNNIVQP